MFQVTVHYFKHAPDKAAKSLFKCFKSARIAKVPLWLSRVPGRPGWARFGVVDAPGVGCSTQSNACCVLRLREYNMYMIPLSDCWQRMSLRCRMRAKACGGCKKRLLVANGLGSTDRGRGPGPWDRAPGHGCCCCCSCC